MLKRWSIYFKEMYPLLSRILLGFLLFFEIYFLVILTNRHFDFNIGVSEIVGAITIFSFLLLLRIADDFKDYKTDIKLFPNRPLPSGRVTKKDLKILAVIVLGTIIPLNIIFMNNLLYFTILMVYGLLMSVWFFSRTKIQKSLPLALITHNPIQLIINLYIISFTCIKYGIQLVSFNNFLILITLYFSGLIWEIGRKIKAPKDETEYVTYSKLFGYKKATLFILGVMFVDMITTSMLLYKLYEVAVVTAVLSYCWLIRQCLVFIKTPEKFTLISKIEKYILVTEATVVIVEIIFLVHRVFI